MFDFADFTDITKMAITLLKMDGFSIFFCSAGSCDKGQQYQALKTNF